MLPESGSISRNTSRLTVDLPQPDSPTSASVLPRSTLKLTPSTALTNAVGRPNIERSATKCFVSPSTSSRSGHAPSSQRSSCPGRCAARSDALQNRTQLAEQSGAPVRRRSTALRLCCTLPGAPISPSRHQPLERRLDAACPVAGAHRLHRRWGIEADVTDKRTTCGEAAAGRRSAMFGTMPSMVARCEVLRSSRGIEPSRPTV
jgi:hypothetical protein